MLIYVVRLVEEVVCLHVHRRSTSLFSIAGNRWPPDAL